MIRTKFVQTLMMAAVMTTICVLPSQAVPIVFDLRGTEGMVLDGLVSGPVTKDGLIATLMANVVSNTGVLGRVDELRKEDIYRDEMNKCYKHLG